MLGTDAAIFVIILGGVYQRNHGKQILSTMYHEVRRFSLMLAKAYFLMSSLGPLLACDFDHDTVAPGGKSGSATLGY
jgi:hypothetical protein